METEPKAPAFLKGVRCLVFDFDGTLVNSNPIKWRAFERCFEEIPQPQRQEILSYCRNHNHTPRWEKFRYAYEKILKLPFTPEVEAALLARFDRETTQPIIEAPEIPGASEFLKSVRGSFQTALLSSTPHEILLRLLKERGWLEYFQAVQGAPVDKARWLEHFRLANRLECEEVLFWGDTEEDAEAAKRFGCRFVAVNSSLDPGIAELRISDFTGLLPLRFSCTA